MCGIMGREKGAETVLGIIGKLEMFEFALQILVVLSGLRSEEGCERVSVFEHFKAKTLLGLGSFRLKIYSNQ